MNNETQREDDLVKLYLKKSTLEERRAQFAALVASGADPDDLARRIANKVAEDRQERRRRGLKRLFTTILVAVPVLIILLFLFVQPMKETTRVAIAAWLASPTPIKGVSPTPTEPTPTPALTPTSPIPVPTLSTPTPEAPIPTPKLFSWTITGKVNRYGADVGLVDTQVSLAVRLSGEDSFQAIPVTIDDSGAFVGEYESTVVVEEARVQIIPPSDSWQIHLADKSAWTRDSADPTVFSTSITGAETPPLALEAVVSRRFSGQVALSTSPEGTDKAGVPDIQLEIEESVDGQLWRPAHCEQMIEDQTSVTLDDQGNFDLTCKSGHEQASYRLRPTLPTFYQASPLVESAPEGWVVDQSGWWTTNHPLAEGEFAELSLVYQLQSITLLVTDPYLILEPDVNSWEKSAYANADTEGEEYEAYVATVTNDNANGLKATWTLFLPAGNYYLEVWTPNGMSAPVRYAVELEQGSAGDPDFNLSYVSRQGSRDGKWWNFVAGDIQPSYPIFSLSSMVTIQVLPFIADPTGFAYDNTEMAVGPIRVVVRTTPQANDATTITSSTLTEESTTSTEEESPISSDESEEE